MLCFVTGEIQGYLTSGQMLCSPSIPSVVQEDHIMEMFIEKTKVAPLEIQAIARSTPTGPGRCHVRFLSKYVHGPSLLTNDV